MSKGFDIKIEKTSNSRLAETDFDNLQFGKVLSDHMFICECIDGEWQKPEIVPVRPLQFSPALSALHYGQTIFEGLKAYKNEKGEVLIFRPDQHAERMHTSAYRISMPAIPHELFLEGLYALLDIDRDWIPSKEGCSYYIRPFMFATDEALRVNPSSKYTFIIVGSPVGAYYSGQVKVLVEQEFVRAAEGGTGFVKTGGNYAASLLPALKAKEKGFDQVLWTDSKEHKYIEEIGTMNVMFQIGNKIITSSLSSSILAGITRKSVLELARKWGYEVEERKVSVQEIIDAIENNTLLDAFGTGTAATITQISALGFNNKEYIIDASLKREFSNKANDYLNQLKLGQVTDENNWMVRV